MVEGGEVLVLKRISTGQAEADEVLRGGFPAQSINIIMGEPGTGKTILAEQILFTNAGGDRRAVYISTLSEPLSKVITFLQTFDFYDEAKMLESVVYQEVSEGLLEKGIEYLLDHVSALIRELRPGLLVVDSFKALHDLAASPNEMRRLVTRLGTLLSGYDITTFFVGEYTEAELSKYPEFAVADGIIQLSRMNSERLDERFLRVLKLRGSDYLEGMHALTITSGGLRVFPRLVAPKAPAPYEVISERVHSGVPGLDQLLDGGLRCGTSTAVIGQAGAGKTTLGLTFAIEGVRQDGPALVLHFEEDPSQLARTIRALGADLEALCKLGLHLRYFSPVELQIDSVVTDAFAIIEREGIRRVVVDAISDLRTAVSTNERLHDYLYSMLQYFAVKGITSLMTYELGCLPMGDVAKAEQPEISLSSLFDVLMLLQIDLALDPPRRLARIIKARGIAHPLMARPFVIESGGIRLEARGDNFD